MKWEFLVSLRYLLAKRREKFISVTTFLSITSVTIGVAALIVVLAVMNGFGDELREKIVGFNYHIQIFKYGGIENPDLVIDKISRFEGISSATPFINGQAIVLSGDNQPRGILIRGIDAAIENKSININIVKGELDLKDNEIAVGNELAKLFKVKAGDGINLVTGLNVTPKSFKVAAVFHSGMYDYDANVAFVNINSAKILFRTGENVQGIGVRLTELDKAKWLKPLMLGVLKKGFVVNTWSELNKNLFAAIKLEKILVFIVVALTIAVGALNIISTLSLLTLEKTKDIGILKALGATRMNIANIYVFKGLLIGTGGAVLGFLLGLGITTNINEIAGFISKITGFKLFSKQIYYLDKIPATINYIDIWVIILCAVGLSFLAALYPAWHASNLDPVEALRYE